MGTGSNMLRTGLVHSTGTIYLGSYGPQPAILWKYDPAGGRLVEICRPGEYQLDSMVEAPNGKVYIGTAYSGIVYELDPATEQVTSLGAPPVDSTTWIFTMVCTRDGEIFGARGVGIFHLDWRTGRMESCGIVPGSHATPGPGASNPIVRTLEERPDGLLWGDTNRWIFLLDPRTRQITPVADIAALDEACYAVVHALGAAPVNDLYFQVYSRFSGRRPKHGFGVCRADSGEVELFDIEGLQGRCWVAGWWSQQGEPRWLVAQHDDKTAVSKIGVVDIHRRRVVEEWEVEGHETPPVRLAGPGLWFHSTARGTLYRAEPAQKRLVPCAHNPVPVECRCLAASPAGELGTDTNDCGFVFTFDLHSKTFTDHGRVWLDDHRCNYGPAAFAGADGGYFVANHGQPLPKLWVTDLHTNSHRQAGEPAIQLVRSSDGTVWGTQGDSPSTMTFEPAVCWIPAWHARPGTLFRYVPGAEKVEEFPEAGPVGPLAESPAGSGALMFGSGNRVKLFDVESRKVIMDTELPCAVVAIAADLPRQVAYLVLADGRIYRCVEDSSAGSGQGLLISKCAEGFGQVDRGCFVLPASGRLVGISLEGSVSVYDPRDGKVSIVQGPSPLPAGPAVDPQEDAWYFADRVVTRYSLAEA